ncbi:hypothetical protein [Rhizobium sp. BR 314]|uniref:hypothetical protein n=1 Tax=Rhizobium sp. BR 314 TaxID=3040013 RepID=UPI0039BEF736
MFNVSLTLLQNEMAARCSAFSSRMLCDLISSPMKGSHLHPQGHDKIGFRDGQSCRLCRKLVTDEPRGFLKPRSSDTCCLRVRLSILQHSSSSVIFKSLMYGQRSVRAMLCDLRSDTGLKAMRFVDLRLIGMLRSRSRRQARGRVDAYEPWVHAAFDRFEREIAAFYRRSQFTVVA